MREFFKGWRRKAGCAALVMACVLTTLWIRSIDRFDFADANFASFRCIAASVDQRLWFSLTSRLDRPETVTWESATVSEGDWGFERKQDGTPTAFDPSLTSNVDWKVQWVGFHASSGSWSDPPGFRYKDIMLPIWSLVLPFTLLSAYLLLWKPRPKDRPDA